MPDVTGLRSGDPRRIAQYTVRRRLGSGGQGVVYLATAPDGRPVAIKQLLTGKDERAHRQLVKEVAAARRVEPFCTARILDADLSGPSPYVVSEYIEGPSLQQRIQQGGPMTGSQLRWIALGTATALAAIHQAGVVHRDFKPANVMLAADGPRVIDFGIARDLSTETTVTSRVFGTPAYMAPEQLRGEPVGPPTDVFAWASVIAYAATGKAPFEAEHMMAVVYRITSDTPNLTGVPPEVLGVVQRCLAKNPADRPTAQEAVSLLLGRPAPARGPADATQVLAEAATMVHRAVAPAPTVPQQPVAPTAYQQPVATTSRPAPMPPYGRPPPAPPYWPATAPPQPPGRGGAWKGLLIGAGVLVLVLAVRGIVHGAGDGADGTGTSGTASSPAATAKHSPAGAVVATTTPEPDPTTPSTSATTPSDVASTTIPDDFTGTWTGTAYQPVGEVKQWTVEIDLSGGSDDGKMELPSLDCEGTLRVTKATDRKLYLDADMSDDNDGTCADHATVEFSLLALGRAQFSWQDSTSSINRAAGILSKGS